jgi:LysM repeat protein
MKPQTLPVKRSPETKGIFKRLRAVTGDRKQRVAATAPADFETSDGSSKISRALTIIFLIHIVAIGLIFVHQKFLEGRTSAEPKVTTAVSQDSSTAVASRSDLPRLAAGEKPYIVRQGDNYTHIASVVGVDEGDLRLINKHVDIVPGLLLKVPPKRAVVTEEEAEKMPLVAVQVPTDGLVSVEEAAPSPKAKLVKPSVNQAASTKTSRATASGKTYVVKSGDSVWRIANRFKVSQEKMMKLNGISDAGKLKVGATLEIPQ